MGHNPVATVSRDVPVRNRSAIRGLAFVERVGSLPVVCVRARSTAGEWGVAQSHKGGEFEAMTIQTHASPSALLPSVVFAAIAIGCAPTQVVLLNVEPKPVVLYLDGEAQKQLPESLELKSDRDHKLFFRKEGYQPELVVLVTKNVEGEPALVPDRVDVQLQRLRAESRPDLSLTIEDDE